MCKLNEITLSLIASLGVMFPALNGLAIELKPYSPELNDNRVGAYCVRDGTTQTLSGLPQFARGASGKISVTLNELQRTGKIINDDLINKERLDPGEQNRDILIFNAETNTFSTYQVYDNNQIANLPVVAPDTVVPDYIDVNDAQYINARVASVKRGVLNINIGDPAAAPGAATNSWSMAAKQSALFTATRQGELNWDSSNRIAFTAATPPTTGNQLSLTKDSVVTWKGNIAVTTLDGNSETFNVSSLSDLQNYNTWLIRQLARSNLKPDSYNSEFNKAFSLSDGSVTYLMSTDNSGDEIAQQLGDQVVLSADGPGASVAIRSGKTLEVMNNSTAAMRASNGAAATVDGKLASTGPVQPHSRALELINGSTGTNNGVINGGFFNNADGSGVDRDTLGYISQAVAVLNGSQFTNNGVINLSAALAPASVSSQAIWLDKSSAVNNGTINVGVAEVANASAMTGVKLSGNSTFINGEQGTLYLGRSPQNKKTDATTDLEVDPAGSVSAIDQSGNSSAINNGHIVIGSKMQGAVGMRIEEGPNALAINSGVIDINAALDTVSAESIGMLAINAGSGGRVGNIGDINLNGNYATGIRAIARNNSSASIFSTGSINLNGNANYNADQHNTAVWLLGEEGGNVKADISGPIRLNGYAGIGIRAEGNATANLTSSAVPQTGEGWFQIHFLAIGQDARINLPANGSYATSNYFSTLFRYQDGADFDGRGMTLSPKGYGSVGVMGSGEGTEIQTHDATINIGQLATGVLVEGGAQGTIDADTRLNMTAESANAATVDGNKRKLNSEYIDPFAALWTSTLLTNHAAVNGAADFQSGLKAMNQAQLVNTGDLTFSGRISTAIEAYSGAKVMNSGDVTVARGGTGIRAYGYYYTLELTEPTLVTNVGTLNIYGGTGVGTSPTYGILASDTVTRVNQNGTINLYGDKVVGAQALTGATINLGPDSKVVFHGPGQTGYQAEELDSALVSRASSNDVSTAGSTLYRLSDGAAFYPLTPASVTLSGANSNGIIASGESTVLFGTDNFRVTGEGATAVRIADGAEGNISQTITLDGKSSVGVVSEGDAATAYVSSRVAGDGANATAFIAGQGAMLENQEQGQVELTGPDSTGVRLYDGGRFINSGSVRVASGTGLNVSSGLGEYRPIAGELRADDGIAALRVGKDASLRVNGDNQESGIIRAGGSADALLLDVGARSAEISNVVLSADGEGSVINNRAETPAISLQNVTLDVNGSTGIRSATSFDPDGSARINVSNGGTGYLFANADGSTTHNDLTTGRDYAIVVSGEGDGIRANTTGRVVSQGAITIRDVSGGSAIITRTASEVINQGAIASFSRVAPVIDLRGGQTVFINEGTIFTPDPDTVVVAGGATSDKIALLDGSVVGEVNTGDGGDTLILAGGTLEGGLAMGSGPRNQAIVQRVDLGDTRHITSAGGAESTLNLSDINARGGSFADDDLSKGTNLGSGWSTLNFYHTRWTLTDNIRMAHSTINIDSGSTLFAGDNVNPVLQGGADDSLIVNNAGTLDLTNGGATAQNTLTINGSLVSTGGRLRLNSTAAQSDLLRVNGNVSGVTLIEDTLAGGTLTDANDNRVTDVAEGVSLAQVSGSAEAGSFALQNGYVASGPWQYRLYSFAPGSDEPFWDYRLANAWVCEDGALCQPQTGSREAAVRPAVTPQVPSYLSAPVGLAYYTLAVTDDLHRRLGELRHQQTTPDAVGGEMFLRYFGSNMEWQSNRTLSRYGYDFDLDYNAVQLGGNLLRVDGAQDSLRGGVAWTHGNTRIRPHAADGYSSTSFDSDSVALYGTWQRDGGLYLDGSLAWNWHRGETDIARQKEVASPKGDGWTASLESGYPLTLGNGFHLEPQAQLTHLSLKMDDLTDKDDATVAWDRYEQTIGRLGARLDRTWQDDRQGAYTPYLRVNYYRGWGGEAKVKVGSGSSDSAQNFYSGKFGQMWDVGLGGTATFKKDISLYAEVDYRKEIDGNGAKGWRYNAGVRWSF
ncbi:autotransporter outer membrane beta-barrel domain-containing protein [Candidatus Pantoea deserta]|uniref:Autotransporter outer membrane beta-barrel domain-containing protein n=1 Tax=Candidatus Pantoea deserta TaxID=1869313 RepID=A0A3N4P7T2_9GAMM|nr:autotransporter outer membrane beta-barrel domain-containing protein [Pantoea deserta]